MKIQDFSEQIQKYLEKQLNDKDGWIKYSQKNLIEDNLIDLFIYPMNCIHYFPEQFIQIFPKIAEKESLEFKKGDVNILGTHKSYIYQRGNNPLTVVLVYCYYTNLSCGKSQFQYDSYQNRYRFMFEGLNRLSDMMKLFFMQNNQSKMNIGVSLMLDAPQNGMDPNKMFNLVFETFSELKKHVNLILMNC